MTGRTPRGLSLRAKVVGSYLGVLLIFGTVLGFALLQMAETRANLSSVASGYMGMARDADRLASFPLGYALARSRVDWDRYQPNLDLLYLDQMERHLQTAIHGAEELQLRLESPVEIAALRETRAQLELVGHLLQSYRQSHERLQVCLARGEAGCTSLTLEDLRTLRQQIGEEVQILGTKVEIRIQNALETAGATQMQASQRLLWLSSTAIVLAGLMLLLVHLSLRPISHLIRGAQRIGEGQYERVEVETHDEIGKLAEAFNSMADSLAQRERRIVQMEQLATVGRMAAQVAHEVRNPLNALGLNAEMLGDELDHLPEPSRAEARELLGQLQGEIDRLADVTETYLSLARLPRPELSPGDLGELVDKVLTFVRDELAGAGVDVEMEVEPGLPQVPLDQRQMRQALLNLVRNAVEAQPGGGNLGVRVRSTGDGVQLHVEDGGPGVEPEVAEALFDPFVSTKERGTGLGLAITRQIVEGHGGTIDYHSIPDGGAAFIVRLPLTRRD
jgi:two-component system, NtrC family, sensor kinase